MSTPVKFCPVCTTGTLIERTRNRQVDAAGIAVNVRGLQYSECENCGESITTAAQSRKNKELIQSAKQSLVETRDADLLSPQEVFRIRKQLGLTQVQASRVSAAAKLANDHEYLKGIARAALDYLERSK